jgi:hypothetical protein
MPYGCFISKSKRPENVPPAVCDFSRKMELFADDSGAFVTGGSVSDHQTTLIGEQLKALVAATRAVANELRQLRQAVAGQPGAEATKTLGEKLAEL